MIATAIDTALGNSVRTARVIIGAYGEGYPRSERPHISCTPQAVYESTCVLPTKHCYVFNLRTRYVALTQTWFLNVWLMPVHAFAA